MTKAGRFGSGHGSHFEARTDRLNPTIHFKRLSRLAVQHFLCRIEACYTKFHFDILRTRTNPCPDPDPHPDMSGFGHAARIRFCVLDSCLARSGRGGPRGPGTGLGAKRWDSYGSLLFWDGSLLARHSFGTVLFWGGTLSGELPRGRPQGPGPRPRAGPRAVPVGRVLRLNFRLNAGLPTKLRRMYNM